MKREPGISRHALLCIKQVNDKVPLCSTGSYTQ